MDAKRFDQIARLLSASGARRGLLHVLLALPFADDLALLGPEASEAKRRTRRAVSGENHKHKGRRRKHKAHRRRHKSPKRCKPESVAQTCAGRCGSLENNCRQAVDCGPCDCGGPCPVCQTCDASSGQCVPDPATVGQECAPGMHCKSDGSCTVVCDAGYHACGSCCSANDSPLTCGDRCTPCGPGESCDGATCRCGNGLSCQDGRVCCDGQCCPAGQLCDGAGGCVEPSGCCSGNATCGAHTSAGWLCCQAPLAAACCCESSPGAGDGVVRCCDPLDQACFTGCSPLVATARSGVAFECSGPTGNSSAECATCGAN
jgi:hypothetical protein